MDAITAEKIDEYVENHQEEILSDLKRLVQIPSVSVPGSPEPEPFGRECARVLAEAIQIAEEKGMTARNYGNWYGIATRGEGTHTVGIFSHLDVVEAGDDWTFPPFEMTEKDGWLFGRGVADDKVAAVMGFHTAKALDELDLARNIKLLLYLGVCEEKGMSDLDRYLAEQEMPDFSMVPDFMFPVSIGEQGLVIFHFSGDLFDSVRNFAGGEPGKRLPMIASADYIGPDGDRLLQLSEQRERVTAVQENGAVHITAEGKPASTFRGPDSVNAIAALASFLSESGVLTGKDADRMAAIRRAAESPDGSGLEIACDDELFGSLACTCLTAEEKDGKLNLKFDIRYPMSITGQTIRTRVDAFAEQNGFEVLDWKDIAPWSLPADDPRVQILVDCWNEVSGRSDKARTGGGTYAKKLKNAVSYGPKDYRKCPFLPANHGEIHSPDETRSIETILNAVKVYIRAYVELDAWYAEQERESAGRQQN